MFKYIGIRGHRGAGKQSVAYLIGIALDYYYHHRSWDGFSDIYRKACDDVCVNREVWRMANLDRVQFESFGDGVKYSLSSIFNIPKECMDDDRKKDSTYINLKDFKMKGCVDDADASAFRSANVIRTASELYDIMHERAHRAHTDGIPNIIDYDIWINLRELILYYGKILMQGFLGKNVWIKSYAVNESEMNRFYADNRLMFKIFIDCKFPCELTYIIGEGGKIVEVERDCNRKKDSDISGELSEDRRHDFLIQNNGSLYDLQEDVKCITLQILGHRD